MSKLNFTITATSNTNAAFRSVRLAIIANSVGATSARIYLDGSGAPGFTAFTDSYAVSNLAEGLYRVDYRDTNGDLYLGKFVIKDSPADTCYPELGLSGLGRFFFSLFDNKIKITVNEGIWIGHTTAEAQAIAASKASVDNGVSYKDNLYQSSSGMLASSEWLNSELDALGVTNVIDQVTIKRNSNNCTENVAFELNLLNPIIVLPPLSVTGSKTNCTANGSNDGTINIVPSGGSGSYTYLWNDSVTTQNRNSLSPGIYSVTVTDTVTAETASLSFQITEPAPPVLPSGSILFVPMLNSITFRVNPINPDNDGDDLRTLDNVMFCHQKYGAYQETNYFIKVCQADNPKLQFYSDFPSHVLTMRKYSNDAIVKNFTPVLVEQNIGLTEEYAVSIKNNTGFSGQCRVYFSTAIIPIPLIVGDVFEIFGNGEGMNGNYSVVAIRFDSTLNSQYLVISLNYTGTFGASAGTGKFLINTVDFNVFEVVLDVSDMIDGHYFFLLTALNSDGSSKEAESEPISLKPKHKNTSLVRYFNVDNADDITWTTGYTGIMRVESLFGHKPLMGGVRTTSRDSDYSLVKVSSKKSRGIRFETFMLPPYLHEKLSCIFDLDTFTINGVDCQTDEAYADPTYLDKTLLSNSSIKVEEKHFFGKYNSNDIGSVNGGFLALENGLLKL